MSDVGGDLTKYVEDSTERCTGGNYTEADGLVLSELSYFRYEDLDWSDPQYQDGITVQEMCQNLYDSGKYGSEDEQKFLEAMMSSDRYKNLEVTDMAALNGNTYWDNGQEHYQLDNGQWGGLTVDLGDGNSAVAFRGTDGTKLGWDEDLQLGYDVDGTAAQKASRDFLERQNAEHMNVAGHSKGGNDAEAGYAMANDETRAKIDRVDNYDGPTTNDVIKDQYPEQYAELEAKQHNHYTENSVIGQLLGDHPGEEDFNPADTEGHRWENTKIGEHDPFSWSIDSDGNFKEGDQSDFSKDLDYALDETLEDFGEPGRLAAISIVEKLGVTAILDSDMPGLLKALRILTGLGLMTPGEWGVLILFGADVLRHWLEKKLKDLIEEAKKHFSNDNKGTSGGSYRWYIDLDVIRKIISDLYSYREKLLADIREMEEVKNNLDGFQYLPVIMVIEKLIHDLRKESKSIGNLHTGLSEILAKYVDTEETITNYIAV